MDKEFIGIIIPKSLYERLPQLSGSTLHMFSIWEETAKKHQLTPCFFRFFDIRPGEAKILAYVQENSTYQLKQVPSPTVVYSRVLDRLPPYQSHIESLMKKGIKIFNVPNYDVEKYKIHEILMKDSYIRKHLPQTELFTIKKLNELALIRKQVILKQNYGEFGLGTMKLEKMDKGWKLFYKIKGEQELKQLPFNKILPAILQKRVQRHTYLIQEVIPLATFKGRPFDMRVAVQKNRNGEFQVSGIMCKVANDQDFLTNGAQGGSTFSLEEITPFTHPSIPHNTLVDRIESFSVYVANFLDGHFPHLADLGFDIGITKDGTPYFIECNFISDYESGLYRAGRLINEEWTSVFSTPIDYAKYLLSQS